MDEGGECFGVASEELPIMTFSPNIDAPFSAMIAPLGGKPQVVTFALDALLGMGVRVERVVAVHLSARDERIRHSIDALKQDLPAHYGTQAPRFESLPIRAEPPIARGGTYTATAGRPIEQTHEPAAPDAIWMTLHRLIATLKTEGLSIELCLAGGPRLISLRALSAASLLFTPQDRCWHLYTPEDLRERAGEGCILHAGEGEGVRLISVPLVPVGLLVPGLRQAAFMRPEDFMRAAAQRLSAEDERRCREVIGHLTPRQREVLREFARGGGNAAEVGARLHVSPATVNSHKAVILGHCRNAWGVPPEQRMDFHFLREHFGALDEAHWE